MAVLLPPVLFRFSSLLLRIENPYTQWVWIANPDQRHGVEHPLGRVCKSLYSMGLDCKTRPTARYEHPLGRVPRTISIRRDRWVLVRHRVDAQPHGHKIVVHIAGTEISVAGFLVALLIVFNFIQRYSPPLWGSLPVETKG